MIGKVLYISLLAMTTITYAQNVGINTKKPNETLDVKGSMRIEDVERVKKGVIPLGWLPVKENTGDAYNGEGKVVRKTDEWHTPMAYLTYKIHLQKKGSDWANGVNLKIDADKYSALITQAYLVKDGLDLSASDPSAYGSYIYAVLKKIDQEDVRPMKIELGKLYKAIPEQPSSKAELLSRGESGDFIMGVAQPSTSLEVMSENSKNYYYFFGDYYKVKPLFEYGPYVWIVNILTIEKPKAQ